MSRRWTTRTIVFGVTIDYQLRYHDGLYQLLAKSGWDVHLVAGPGPIGDRLEDQPGITLHRLEMARNPSPPSDLKALWQWLGLLRRIRPAALVVGTPKAGLLGSIAARLVGVSVRIYELHGLRLESATGVLRRLLRAMEWLACATSSQVIAVSPSLRQRAINEKLVPPGQISVLGAGSPNGVDIEHFSCAAQDMATKQVTRDALGLEGHAPVVTFIGRLAADKGLDVLGDAMVEVERAVGARLLVIGPIDDESGRHIVGRLRGTLSGVIFAGEVDDVAPYLAISDVFCLPSRREGLPTVILEAFAAGVPVVGTRATGIVDLVNDGVTGRLVDVDAPDELASNILALLGKTADTRQLVDAARETVERLYSERVVQAEWEAELTTLTERAAAG